MLIPFETIAIILYLASVTDNSQNILNTPYSLLAITAAALLCFLVVSLETIILLKRNQLYSKKNRFIAGIFNSFNKVLSCIITLALFEYYNIFNIYDDFIPSLTGNYSMQNITGMCIYIFITIFTWLPWYYVHKRITPGVWSPRSYLQYKIRYTFFILGIWIPGILLTDYVGRTDSIVSANDIEILSTILFLLIAWIFPVFLRKFWGCTKLEDKELRENIIKLAKDANVNIKGIYLWSLGGKSIPNAAMVGFFPPFQYLFISHGLINRLKKDEVLGVVAHEIGHLKKRHILFYLLMSVTLLSIAEPIVYHILQNRIYTIAGLVGLFFLYIRFVFAWFSRRFEREADLFSLELLKDFRPLNRGLERIGLACGNIRNEASWHHYGISERVRFLESCYFNGVLRQKFKRDIRILRFIAVPTFIILLSMTSYFKFYNPDNLNNSDAQKLSRKEITEKHLQNVLELEEVLNIKLIQVKDADSQN